MTNSTPTQLLVRKKITAIYADGSSKMNLCIATVVRMLKGATNVPVEVAADAAARKLLAELAASAGRTIERASAGIFLTPPVVQPGVDQRAIPAVPAAPAVPAGPKPRRTRGNGKVKPRAVRKYPTLSRRLAGGQHFSRGALYLMLQNRLYRGDIVHQGEAYPDQHEAILDPELWQIVQNKLAVHRQERALAVGAEAPSLLAGLIVDADGNPMTPTHAKKRAKRYRYYVSASLLDRDHSRAQKGMRIPAGDIEALVLDRLRVFFSSRIDVSDAVAPLDLEAHPLDAALRNAFGVSERWLAAPPVVMKSLVRDIVEQITVAADRIEIRLSRANVAAALEAGGRSHRPDLDPVVLSIEAKLQRAGKGKRLVLANGAEAEVNAGLVELIKDAFTIQIQLLSGSDASIEAMSGRLGMNKGRLTSLIRLSHLAPEIVGALLAGRHPIELTPTRLLRLSKNLPHDWKEQRRFLGFAA